MADHTPAQHVERIRQALEDVEGADAALGTALENVAAHRNVLQRKIGHLHARLHRAAKEYPDLLGMTEGEVAALSAGGEKGD